MINSIHRTPNHLPNKIKIRSQSAQTLKKKLTRQLEIVFNKNGTSSMIRALETIYPSSKKCYNKLASIL